MHFHRLPRAPFPNARPLRGGLTLIEVIVAIVVFTVGGLGLAASSAAITRQLAQNSLRSRTAFIARSRAELAHGGGCGSLTSGAASESGVRSTWLVEQGSAVSVDQRVERPTSTGIRTSRFMSAAPCD